MSAKKCTIHPSQELTHYCPKCYAPLQELAALRADKRTLANQNLAAIDIILQAEDTPISTEVLRALGYGGA